MSNPAFDHRCEVIRDIVAERIRQEQLKDAGKFPYTCADAMQQDFDEPDRNTDSHKMCILTEENGEVARIVCETGCGNRKEEETDADLYTELVQVAAVATAWCESIRERQKLRLDEKQRLTEEWNESRRLFPVGTRVKNAYRIEMFGTVTGITERGYIEVHWDGDTSPDRQSFSRLSLIHLNTNIVTCQTNK